MELITQPNHVTPEDLRKSLTNDIDLLQELIRDYESRASVSGLSQSESTDLDILIDRLEETEKRLLDFDKQRFDTIALLQNLGKKSDIYDNARRSFHDISSEKGQEQLLDAVTIPDKITQRRTREQIEYEYKSMVFAKRPNLDAVFTINQLLRAIGSPKVSKGLKAYELTFLKLILHLKNKFYSA